MIQIFLCNYTTHIRGEVPKKKINTFQKSYRNMCAFRQAPYISEHGCQLGGFTGIRTPLERFQDVISTNELLLPSAFAFSYFLNSHFKHYKYIYSFGPRKNISCLTNPASKCLVVDQVKLCVLSYFNKKFFLIQERQMGLTKLQFHSPCSLWF